ncbi:MAG: homoserine kinase [Dehalococcoidia bacterium]
MSQRTISVRVPATSANLGPGFDSLGIALDWAATVRVTVSDSELSAPQGPIERMAVTAALALYQHAAVPPPTGITATCEGDIPVGRGMGVSALARVAGLLAADALLSGDGPVHTREELLPLAYQLEDHGDNVTPALFGGLQVVVADDDGIVHAGIEPPRDLCLALLIPEFSMPTEESRTRLPQSLTRNQSVHNIGRAALLVAALSQGRYDLLNTATEDLLHQPARATIFTPMYPIFQAARDAGAHGVYLSGGGSTIAAFATTGAEDIAGAMREAAAARGIEAATRVVGFSTTGAEIVARE